MKKKLSVICFAFLGMMNISSVLADKDTNRVQSLGIVGEGFYDGAEVRINEKFGNKSVSNGIMNEEFIRNINNRKNEEARDDARRAQKKEKEIDIGSIHFLKFNREMDEVFIPNPDVLDVNLLSKKSLYYSGLSVGKTSLIIRDEEGRTLCDYLVKVTYPLGDIKEAIAKIFPDLEIDLVSINNNLILKGSVASPEMAKDVLDIVGRFVDRGKIINKLTIETATQVMLKVKIAEVTRNVTKSLGINWRALSSSGPSGGLIGMAAGKSTDGFPEFSTDVAKDLLETDGILTSKIGGGRWIMSAGINNLSALIEALASESFATILAEPNLVALSGKPATFKSGGEHGYNVPTSGSNAMTTEFKKWGTSIEFTPVVLSEDRINIKVKAEVSSIEASNTTDSAPNLATKNVETVVELGSGQSLALAGLMQKTKNTNATETPLLAEIPLIGSLFRSTDVNSVERELVIIVTPYIVKPSSKQLKTPMDMIPKVLSPLKSVVKRRFHRLGQEADSAGFSLK
ncbi:MAG: pilus assembly protein N-terminal domain-containing protein [Alphaproteobacteria bacterium]|nr:pilus assembly protein N-terminal domain-containing protein [Alphaproteobacteria bacterium]